MVIQKREPIFDEWYSDNKLFAWSAVAILSAAFFLIHKAFVTLFKHNFTKFSTYSEAYINGLQKHMLSYFGFHFEVNPQLIIQSSKIGFHVKIKDTLFFQA